MKRKILSTLLAIVLVFAMAIPALAEGQEPLKLIVAAHVSDRTEGSLMVDAAISAITQEKLNVTVETLYIPGSERIQQYNLAIASGEQLDLILSGSNNGFDLAVAKGQLTPLDELLAQYGQNIIAVTGEEVLNGGRVNGVLYGIPTVRDLAASKGFVVRTDLLEKYNVDSATIKTLEDLTGLFQLFKENEPNMYLSVGKNGPRALAEDLYSWYYEGLGSWGSKIGVRKLFDEDTTLQPFYCSEGYLEMVKLVREWFQAGYIPMDAVTNPDSGVSKVKAGTSYGYFFDLKPGAAVQETNLCGTDMTVIEMVEPFSTNDNIRVIMMAVPITTADAARTIQLLDLFYTDPALVNLFDYGIEGTHYVYTDDGHITYPEGVTAATTTYSSLNYVLGNAYIGCVWAGNPLDIWDQMKAFNANARKTDTIGFAFNAENVTVEMAACANVFSEYALALGTGTVDWEEAYPEFTSKLEAAGYATVIAEEQKQLDAWLAAK